MAMACTQWGWSAEAFWQATPQDLKLILEGMQAVQATRQRSLDDKTIIELRKLISQHKEKSHGV